MGGWREELREDCSLELGYEVHWEIFFDIAVVGVGVCSYVKLGLKLSRFDIGSFFPSSANDVPALRTCTPYLQKCTCSATAVPVVAAIRLVDQGRYILVPSCLAYKAVLSVCLFAFILNIEPLSTSTSPSSPASPPTPILAMSTIASSRNPPAPLRRTPSGTPTSSARPSSDVSRSAVTSPVLAASQPATTAKRSNNRAALREYYNLRAAAAAASSPSTPRIIEIPDSEVPGSEIDALDFNLDEYLQKTVAESTLQELLKLYTRVLGEVRALDAEKKALVYDNYSKLIAATETIRKVCTMVARPGICVTGSRIATAKQFTFPLGL